MIYWYAANSRELFVDLDQYSRKAPSGGAWGEVFFRRRLRDAILGDKLNVQNVFLAPSTSPKHYHAVVELMDPMTALERLVWQLVLGSDLYRGRADLMRLARRHVAPSILIRSTPLSAYGYARAPDAICKCSDKHSTTVQHALGEAACPVWRRFRGASPWELFGGPAAGSRKERGVPLPMGMVPLDKLCSVVL